MTYKLIVSGGALNSAQSNLASLDLTTVTLWLRRVLICVQRGQSERVQFLPGSSDINQ